MKFRSQILALTALGAMSTSAMAQASAPPLVLPELPAPPSRAGLPASAPLPGQRMPPRPRTAAETATQATAPGDLKPERPVAPQLSVPFGKQAPAPAQRVQRNGLGNGTRATGGVDDGAARCEAQSDPQLRAQCKARAP